MEGPKILLQNYHRQAEELSGGGSANCSAYHKKFRSENVQYLESCGFKYSKSRRVSSVSLHDCWLDSELRTSIQLLSTTSIPAIPSLKAQIVFLESAETLRKDSVHTAPPTVQSARLSESSYKRRPSSIKKSYSNSANDGDRIHLKRAKRADPSEAINFLFKSYAETFKSFSAKKQVLLKIQLAKLFADAELDEMKESSVVFSSVSVANEHDSTLGIDLETMNHSLDSDISSRY